MPLARPGEFSHSHTHSTIAHHSCLPGRVVGLALDQPPAVRSTSSAGRFGGGGSSQRESHMSAALAILTLAREQRPWLQDVLRRLALRSSLSETDHAEILALCVGEHGLSAFIAAPACEPLGEPHMTPSPADVPKIVLNGLSDVKKRQSPCGEPVTPVRHRRDYTGVWR